MRISDWSSDVCSSDLATLALVVVAGVLLRMAGSGGFDDPVNVYLLGNWAAPFGIVLVLDKLSALMLMLTSILAFASLVFSLARWPRAGVQYHALFQFLLMGLKIGRASCRGGVFPYV